MQDGGMVLLLHREVRYFDVEEIRGTTTITVYLRATTIDFSS